MQVNNINNISFGLRFTERAKTFIQNEYRTSASNLIAMDRIEAKYPDTIVLDIKEIKPKHKGLFQSDNRLLICGLRRMNSPIKAYPIKNSNPKTIEKKIKSFLKII